MKITTNKLYLILPATCLAGYVWLCVVLFAGQVKMHSTGVCLIKQFTTIPCPSCGTTRSIVALVHGDFISALIINPFGILIAGIMIAIPFWLIYDLMAQRTTLLHFYTKVENGLRKPRYAIPLIVLVVANWIWNVTKGI